MSDSMANFQYRFGGIARLYGAAALERFRRSRVCVVGIGGVGSWVVEALARSGIGKLTLVDLDDICESNINRQIHSMDGFIGSSKIGVMADRCRAINPECAVDTVHAFLTQKNAASLMENGFDLAIDAIDSAKHKVALIMACRERRIPVITIGGAGGRIDPSLIQIADLSRSFNDPLLGRVRKLLRSDHGFPREKRRLFDIPCVFSPEDARYPEACEVDSGEATSVRLDCSSGYGAATHLTGTFGFFAAAAALRLLASPAPSTAAEAVASQDHRP